MNNGIQLVSDSDGVAVIGNPTDVERFLLEQGLDRVPSKDLDLRRLGSLLGAGGAATKVGSELRPPDAIGSTAPSAPPTPSISSPS